MLQLLALTSALGIGAHGLRPQPPFDYDARFSGGLLELERRPKLCINGSCVAPSFVYEGKNCNSSGCTPTVGAVTLARVAVATQPDYQVPTPTLLNETAVGCNGSDYYQESSAALGAFGTDDIVIELVYKVGNVATAATGYTLFSSYDSGDNQGIELTNTTVTVGTSGTTTLKFGDGTGTVTYTGTAGQGRRRGWAHAMFFLDRSGSLAHYQGYSVEGTSVAISGRQSALTAAHKFTICARPDGTQPWDGDLAYLAIWHAPNWLDTHLQYNVNFIRNLVVGSVWPKVWRGVYDPTLITSGNSAGSQGSGVSYTITKCDSGVCQIFGALSRTSWSGRQIDGTQGTRGSDPINGIGNSEDISTGFTKQTAGDTFSLNGLASPMPRDSLADGTIADGTTAVHGMKFTQALSAAPYSFGVFAKVGNKNWAFMDDNIVANVNAYFDLSTCSLGTVGAGVTKAYAISFGGGWCRIGITFTGTAVSHIIRFTTATADGANSFAGDAATVNTWWWGFSGEQNIVLTDWFQDSGNATGGRGGFGTYPISQGFNWQKNGHISGTVKNYIAYVKTANSSMAGGVVGLIRDNLSEVWEARYSTTGSASGTTNSGLATTYNVDISWSTSGTGEERLFVNGVQEAIDTSITEAAAPLGPFGGGRTGGVLTRAIFWNHNRH